MRTTLLPGLGQAASAIGLGCMRLHPERERESFELLDAYRQAGGNLFDTAEIYGGGQSERALGLYFRKCGGKGDAIVVSKGCVEPRLVRPDVIRSAIDRSLDRLQQDSIDVYLLHRDDPQVPVGELVEVLNEAQRAGKIRSFGGSNWGIDRLQAANDYAEAHGLTGFSVSSPHLGLAAPREPWWPDCTHCLDTDWAWYDRAKVVVLAWSSQCRGFFSAQPIDDIAYMADVIRVYYSAENLARRERLFALAKERDVDPGALAISYVLSLPLSVIALIGPLSLTDLSRALTATQTVLESPLVEWLKTGATGIFP